MFFKKSATGMSQTVSGPVEYLVVGLGNPGLEYDKTRHNAGFMAVDYIAGQLNMEMKKLKYQSLCGESMVAAKRVLFLKPSTYMNLSGQAVQAAVNFYKIPMENVIVLCDDIALPVGKMRVRRSGSDGGQKGLRNIIYLTGRDDFPRIRIGVGAKPYPQMDLAQWVLSKFTTEDQKQLETVFQNSYEAVQKIVSGQIDQAMNLFN